ncbi:hypothetical protein NQ315_009880 [Exocentrus adspersus]|uniref:C2H2-type domain-containing protein n=1 Tax=Exocentrus adspersus TaxID=1586481 RepID=A0AAV8WIK8_9CUCU|nr:hypothetical protein NQ315_009880 [Exocentrus adspersus]
MSSAKDPAKREQKSTGLKKCFTALVDRKQVNLDLDVLNLMLKKELLINLDGLDKNLADVLPIMLVMYMKSWPGWQRSKEYFSGKLNFREWYEKFHQYIMVRLNFLVKNGYNSVIEEMRREKKVEMEKLFPNKSYTEHGAQTDVLAPKGFAPFSITINCPASCVNSIVFAESEGSFYFLDDIVIKHHPEMPWSSIDIKQLLNWPNVEVKFFMPELSFTRKNCFDYNRYIHFTNIPLSYEKADYIDQVEIIDSSSGRNCYTLNMFKCYVKEYLSVLKLLNDPEVDVQKVAAILSEFLKDIDEIDMNSTMATNTAVTFNIGKSAFLRNKKISKSSSSTGMNTTIGFCEILTPKMETSLNFFKAVQDMTTPEVSFSYLNIVKNSLLAQDGRPTAAQVKPLIVYKCNYCDISFKSDTDIIDHLQKTHKMDPNVLCVKCKKSYSVSFLTNQRWKHACSVVGLSAHQTSRS